MAEVKPDPNINRAFVIVLIIDSSTGALSNSKGPLLEYEIWA